MATELEKDEKIAEDRVSGVDVVTDPVSEGYTTALGPKYGASEGLKRGPFAINSISTRF